MPKSAFSLASMQHWSEKKFVTKIESTSIKIFFVATLSARNSCGKIIEMELNFREIGYLLYKTLKVLAKITRKKIVKKNAPSGGFETEN